MSVDMETDNQNSHPADAISFMAIVGSAQQNKLRGFEGPEKRLEIIVRGAAIEQRGLRAASRQEWADIINILKAQIVNHVHNDEVDAYVLTESSLFVFRHKVLLITCGTTILLHALPAILELIARHRLEVEWASFMRKNFSYPWEQVGPHATMENEYGLLKAHLPLGRPFIFGPIDSDHYFAFVYDDVKRPCVEEDTQISMTMYDFDEAVAAQFFSETFVDGEATEIIRKKSGVATLVEGWIVQDLQFAPCGYSINAIRGGEYQTMHITPEKHCSFASYETNIPTGNVVPLLAGVLAVFRPQRFSVMLLADPQSPIGVGLARGDKVGLEQIEGYAISNHSHHEFAPGYTLVKANFVKE
jgi:S-adenosylmethionine decarboxylase